MHIAVRITGSIETAFARVLNVPRGTYERTIVTN
ncbi:hypothetical protein BH23CHL5_BH23CHL5_02620 [soil metagenome]